MQAIVQLRGEVNIAQDVRDTLTMLNIHRVNHATFVPETDAYRGMISKVNDFVAHGEPSVDVVETLISTRAEPEEGDGDITDEWVSENTDYDDVAALAQAIVDEETTLREQGVSPVLRLHPPRGGHRGQKHVTKEGGQLGKHSTEQIDELLEDMR
ncbi:MULTISPECIES: 50S ribosomal protein L30 [Haloferax]|jgi:large subunit ribosomal protein L30|uniref:Large ribosomal subunit protein uL30 n=4 Tax=Haloferax TaxID=2251 RepID=A0A6C0UVV9_HALVO|nr:MULTISPECIES: 50S ribosomal protein L30 [Haloferax]ELK55463.1 50S ribosomal protein L30P [Haloferax sp. BAB-2207]ELZ55242.1 50S ribosomal protein L30P [Haloferax sp. ATCC BAA-646]ELZ66499.1 50S ribosomal protein L30P [Haloferax sp. ATCC BAA-645]ELZ66688.1 50S ribosomal protein L30P [Haloferax sp. ATCC BAA-644]ELZ76866.1 50S ribosomal protein L30P [Haloferax lucentense DSM 14919]